MPGAKSVTITIEEELSRDNARAKTLKVSLSAVAESCFRMPRFNVYCKCQRRDVSYLMLRMILDSNLPLVSEGGRRRPWS